MNRLEAIHSSGNALRFRTIGTLMRPDVLRGVPRTPLVEPEGSRSTLALGQIKNGPLARFLFGGEGGIRTLDTRFVHIRP